MSIIKLCIISHKSPTFEVAGSLIESPLALVPFTIDAKELYGSDATNSWIAEVNYNSRIKNLFPDPIKIDKITTNYGREGMLEKDWM